MHNHHLRETVKAVTLYLLLGRDRTRGNSDAPVRGLPPHELLGCGRVHALIHNAGGKAQTQTARPVRGRILQRDPRPGVAADLNRAGQQQDKRHRNGRKLDRDGTARVRQKPSKPPAPGQFNRNTARARTMSPSMKA